AARRATALGFGGVKIVALPEVERRERASVAVGTFDGVHLGHREVIDASESVLTFEPHPVSVVAPGHTPKLLTRPERKAELIASLGVRDLIVIPFDAAFATRSVAEANKLLGAPFQLCGEVVRGDERGRTLGFPTANLIPEEALACPGHGVYACLANGHAAAVSIGVRPTFQTGRGELIEAYLVDFEGDLYGSQLCLQFLQRLRGERRFDTPEALVAQMRRDVERTRELVDVHAA